MLNNEDIRASAPHHPLTPNKAPHNISIRLLVLLIIAIFIVGGISFSNYGSANAAGVMSVSIGAAYNLVVDSNVLSPSTYAPSVATVMGEFCNTGDTDLTGVQGFIGDFSAGTPGVYPSRDSTQAAFQTEHPRLAPPYSAGVGDYYFTHVGGAIGTADATRYLGTLTPGECKVAYWMFTYPRRSNLATDNDNLGPEPVWGETNDPNDDLWLEFDIWSTSVEGSNNDATQTMTMRNEISAMANKIEPQGGTWFNTSADIVLPGQTITSNGINYDLGNVNKGFDNDGDFVYDYNAWLQPIGDPSFDPSCFRLVQTYGELTVSRSGGLPDLIIPFTDQLYFFNLPTNNTGVVGEVHYVFLALNGPCSTALSPYQEVASGADNEKFNGDYGTGLPPVGSSEPEVVLTKNASVSTVALSSTITYTADFVNNGSEDAGLPLLNMPVVITDSIPSGTEYQTGTASSTVGTTILYSTDNQATWSTTEPVPANTVTDIQWWLDATLTASGGSGQVSFDVLVPGTYNVAIDGQVIENCADSGFGNAAAFATSCATTLVEGTNSIGDFVWQDDDNDGLWDTGEPGIAGVTVWLYLDDGDQVFDSGDQLILTDVTDGSGIYGFSNLPDGDYFVDVDGDDSDIPDGYSNTNQDPHPVLGLGTTITSPYTEADFGFGPVLSLVKTLTSSNPAYEGETVTFDIELTNNRPGDSTGVASACTYIGWSGAEDATNTGSGPKVWTNPSNAFGTGELDGLYASTDFSAGSGNILAGTSFSLGPQLGTISSVEAIFQIYFDNALVNDEATAELFFPASTSTSLGTNTFTTAQLNAFVGSGSVGIISWDVTALKTWAWTDFTGDISISFEDDKNTSADTAILYLDSIGFRITTSENCGGSQDTISFLPLTDDFDADLLQFVSAVPPADSVTTGGTEPYDGTITWNDLGPLYAGQTQTVTVTYLALEPPDSGVDGENDPATTTNFADSTGATFTNGDPVNDASDSADVTINPTGSIGDTIWNDSGLGGGTQGNGVQDGGELGIPGVTVWLYSDPNGDGDQADGVLLDTQVTDASGNYLFEGLQDASYVVLVDTSSLPGSSFTQTGDPNEAGTCSTCDNRAGTTLNNNNGVSSDDDDLTLDFGYTVPNSIYGNVWEDNDGDATQDAGENAISGVTVELVSAGCTQSVDCPTTTTDANGDYSFVDLIDASYTVVIQTATLPAGNPWSETVDPDEAGVCGTCDSQTTSPIVAAGGNNYGSIDFAYMQTGSNFIGDTVYADWNGDGDQDSGEEGISGITVTLYEDANGDGSVDTSTDSVIATDITDASGDYGFSSLPDGNYIVVVDESGLPAGYSQTQDPDEGGICSTCDGQGQASVSPDDDTVDFGYQPTGTGSIGDTVFQDDNANSIEDSGESGIPDITVTLYEDSNNDGSIDGGDAIVDFTFTDSNGNYTFSNLPAGNYLVDVATNDADLPTDTYGNLYVLSTSNDPHDVTLSAGEDYTDADFGFATGAILGDYIWEDTDRDGSQDLTESGIQNVTVWLYSDPNGDGDASDGVLLDTQITDVDGLYEFTGLEADDYVVIVDTTDGDLPSSTVTSDPDETGLCSVCDGESAATLTPGQTDRSKDFGFQAPGLIGDQVWIDTDGDGVKDAGEPGIAYITVWLYDSTGSTLLQTTSTNSNGEYYFSNVSDATYQVWVDTSDTDFPSGVSQTFDPDEANPCGTCDSKGTVTITGGSTDLSIDFGYRYTGPYSISGTVFHDANSNTVYEPGSGETPFESVSVFLWNSGGTLIGSTTTDVNGDYTFTNLPNGDYTVSVDSSTTPLRGLTQTTPTPDSFNSVTIAGANETGVDFGFVGSTIGDLVWDDLDADGIQDIGEPGLVNVTVELYDPGIDGAIGGGDDILVDTTTTDASGIYSFPGIAPDDYFLDFTLLASYSFSPKDQGGDDALDSDADTSTGQTVITTLAVGEDDDTWDAGMYTTATISDFAWDDLNADGIQDVGELGLENVGVDLYDAGADGQPGGGDDTLLSSTSTDASGNYSFTGLDPGTYFLDFTPPGSYLFSPQDQGGDDALDSDANTSTGQTASTTLISGETDNTWDAGMYLTATISDFVWDDTDEDGIQDLLEPGLENVTVDLYDAGADGQPGGGDDTLISSTTTNASGIYSFTGVTPGIYFLDFTLLAGYTFSPQDQGADDTLDSDANVGTGQTASTDLISGETDTTWDTGFIVAAPALTLVKSITANATYTTVGQVIAYEFLVTNTSNITLFNITVSDDQATDESCPDTSGGLAPGASITCTASYTVTQADLDNGSVVNIASASDDDVTTSPTDTETATATQSPALTLVKSITANATYTTVGQVIAYEFLVTNTGNVTLFNITVSDDQATDESCPDTSGGLAPGAFITCTASYTVTQADLDAGSVVNIASASDDDVTTSPTDTETATATQSPALTLVKSITANATYTSVGQVIAYEFLVTNTGNVTLFNITVSDDQATDESCPDTSGGLAPGA
ncbi:MAG: hypothetical protein FVQ83_10360, partial [Chloroflexi bacterium]|nr:hypothetical protein [Chloroflexota bacterium]